MNAKLLFSVVLFALGLQISGCDRNKISFSADIQPILKASCLNCHNSASDEDADEDAMGEGAYASGFSVANYDDVMKGTSLGPVVVPGSSMSSALYLVVAGKTDPAIRMPPHHDESWAEGRGTPLSANQIEMIAAWIDQGAKNN
ncbi:MAG: hypothetical protein OER91_09965 [Gammaproteobacteria bacterium]|nr:hypothetical protein [Gammaproteobacteria bacterium]